MASNTDPLRIEHTPGTKRSDGRCSHDFAYLRNSCLFIAHVPLVVPGSVLIVMLL